MNRFIHLQNFLPIVFKKRIVFTIRKLSFIYRDLNQISCQYPFEVYREQNTGKPFAFSIFLQLPIFTKEKEYKYKELFQEFVFIPSRIYDSGRKCTKMYKNQYGFLIGKYEVTLAQWKEYLEDLYKKENNWEKF